MIKEIEEKPLIEEIFLITFPFTYSSFYYLYSEHRFCVNSENNSIDFFFLLQIPLVYSALDDDSYGLLCGKVIAFYNHLKCFFHFLLLLLKIIWISILQSGLTSAEGFFVLFCFKIIHFTLTLSLYLWHTLGHNSTQVWSVFVKLIHNPQQILMGHFLDHCNLEISIYKCIYTCKHLGIWKRSTK